MEYKHAELIVKFAKWVDDIESTTEKIEVAILLENTVKFYTEEPEDKLQNLLWLTKEGWIRSNLRKIVSVQPLGNFVDLIYYYDKKFDDYRDSSVGTQVYKHEFQILPDVDFDLIKNSYANLLAKSIDCHIAKQVYSNYDQIILGHRSIDLENKEYDFLVCPKSYMEKTSDVDKNINVYEIPDIMNPYFELICFAGNFKKDHFQIPIFLPNLLLSGKFLSNIGTITYAMRVGWLDSIE